MKFTIRDLLLLTTITALTIAWVLEKNHTHQLTTQIQAETKKARAEHFTSLLLAQQIITLREEYLQTKNQQLLIAIDLEVERKMSENYRDKLKVLTGTPVQAPPQP